MRLESPYQAPPQEIIFPSGNKYPSSVYLGSQVETHSHVIDNTRIFENQKGGTCHIYSAANLFEATCFRYLKVRLNISDGYLVYRHLREYFAKSKSIEISDKHSHGMFIAPHIDGGFPKETLQRIFRGSVCTESTCPFDEPLEGFLKTLVKKGREEFGEEFVTKFPIWFRKSLDKVIKGILVDNHAADESGGYRIKSLDEKI